MTRCVTPECDKPFHLGLHEDRDGFRWGLTCTRCQRPASLLVGGICVDCDDTLQRNAGALSELNERYG